MKTRNFSIVIIASVFLLTVAWVTAPAAHAQKHRHAANVSKQVQSHHGSTKHRHANQYHVKQAQKKRHRHVKNHYRPTRNIYYRNNFSLGVRSGGTRIIIGY